MVFVAFHRRFEAKGRLFVGCHDLCRLAGPHHEPRSLLALRLAAALALRRMAGAKRTVENGLFSPLLASCSSSFHRFRRRFLERSLSKELANAWEQLYTSIFLNIS